MRIALLGDNGMLGREFACWLADDGADFVGFNRKNFDVSSDSSSIARQLQGFDVILNCIAYTAVDAAEKNRDEAFRLNSDLVENLSFAAGLLGNRLVHFSTDYVFDGAAKEPYQLNHPRNPQNVYGLSKCQGEEKIESSDADFSIIRTAWLYGQHGPCFPKTMRSLLLERGHVNVVGDQYGQPTWTKDLVKFTLDYLSSGERFPHIHGVSSGMATWYDFAFEIAKSLGMDPDLAVTKVSSEDFVTAAVRPNFSVLDNTNKSMNAISDWLDRWKVASSSVLENN